MGRQQFTTRNNIGQVLTFQKSGATSSFDPLMSFSSGSRRVSWRLDNGANITQTAGNSITYTGFTSDNGIRTIEMRGNSFKNIFTLFFDDDNIYGNIDLSQINFSSGASILLTNNKNLTGITNPSTSTTINSYQANLCNLNGNLDLTPLSGLGGSFAVNSNPNLTGITHSTSPSNFNLYWSHACNLTGNLNLPFSGLGGDFRAHSNPNLTGITHSVSSLNFSRYYAYSCNLTGNLNLPFSGLGGDFRVQSNSGLTSITHSVSSQNFSFYYASNCNLTGNLDLTPLSKLGGDFQAHFNPNLTGITHSPSTQIFTYYQANNCNLTGNLDLTPLSGLGGSLFLFSNSGLTNVNFTANTQNFIVIDIYLCNLTGTLDLSPLTKLGGSNSGTTFSLLRLQSNPNLTNIIFPNSNQFFKNLGIVQGNEAFALFNCNLDYVDFTPLSGATLVSGTTQGIPRINLRNNGMSTTDVNHILIDFSGNATYNPTGWSNVNLNISGTNGAPDSSSGGYDGIAARNFLTGSPYNWTITHS